MPASNKQLAQWGVLKPDKASPVKQAIARTDSPSWPAYDTVKREVENQKRRAEHFKGECHKLRTSKRWYKGRNERLEQEINDARQAELRIMDMWLEARLLASDLKPQRHGDQYLVDAEALTELFQFMSVGE